MLLTIVIPAYNAQRYLRQTLNSVLSQEGRGLEIIVVNDGSTDSTLSIAEDYARRYPCIRVLSTENRGVSHARNVGIRAASGDYVGFLDADDVLCADAYTPETEALLSEGAFDLVSFGCMNADHSLRFGRLNPERNRILLREDPGFLRIANERSFASRLYRRTLLEELRFFEGIRYAEDSAFSYLAFHRARNAACFDRYWFVYRSNPHSALHNTHGWTYILTDCIPAWARAAESSGDASGRWDCWGMVYSSMGDYVGRSILSGVSLKQLVSDMEHCGEYQKALTLRGQFWTTPETDRLLDRLRTEPRWTWLKLRLKGIPLEIAWRLRKTALLRTIYSRLKYRTPLDGYLPGEPAASR